MELEDWDMDKGVRSDESSESVQYLYQVKRDGESVLQASIKFHDVNNRPAVVKCILDSWASCNVIGKNSAMKILGTKQLKLDSKQSVLKASGG